MSANINIRVPLLLCGSWLLSACNQEQTPRSVQEFLDEPIMLEASMVRCAKNRAETRYDAECVNARQAVSLIEAREEAARREAFEAQSERKRKALRRTQRAAAEARRRTAESERLRKETEYLAQFGELPPTLDGEGSNDVSANVPGAVIPESTENVDSTSFEQAPPVASDGGNAPVAKSEPESDLDAVRDELRRRNEESGE